MKILALEFSSVQRSAAVVEAGVHPEARLLGEAIETGPDATRALALIDAALRQAGVRRDQVDLLAVGLGPGSYTGVRSALAVAQGWQLARDLPVIGLSSMECLAWQARAEQFTGPVHLVLDAQRGEFYLSVFELSAGGCRELEALRLATLAEVREREQSGACLLGPEITRWFPAGRVVFPRASVLGERAAGRTASTTADRLEPVYLRETSFQKVRPIRPPA